MRLAGIVSGLSMRLCPCLLPQDFSDIFREFSQRGDWPRALRLFKYMLVPLPPSRNPVTREGWEQGRMMTPDIDLSVALTLPVLPGTRSDSCVQRHEWCKPTEHIYTIMIGVLGENLSPGSAFKSLVSCEKGRVAGLLDIHQSMVCGYSFSRLRGGEGRGAGREGMLDRASELFESMPEYGVDWNVYSFTALINAFGRNGQVPHNTRKGELSIARIIPCRQRTNPPFPPIPPPPPPAVRGVPPAPGPHEAAGCSGQPDHVQHSDQCRSQGGAAVGRPHRPVCSDAPRWHPGTEPPPPHSPKTQKPKPQTLNPKP